MNGILGDFEVTPTAIAIFNDSDGTAYPETFYDFPTKNRERLSAEIK